MDMVLVINMLCVSTTTSTTMLGYALVASMLIEKLYIDIFQILFLLSYLFLLLGKEIIFLVNQGGLWSS